MPTLNLRRKARPGPALNFGARAYLIVASLHFGLIGLSILLLPEMYTGAAFLPIVESVSLPLWGWAHLVTGVFCTLAAAMRWPTFGRAGMVMAFGVLVASAFAVGWGVAEAWFDGNPATMATPVIPLTFLAMAVKDLIEVGRPMQKRPEVKR
jgi:hypothetical protein